MGDLNDGVLKGIALFNQDSEGTYALRREIEDNRVCLAAARKLRKQHEKEIKRLNLELGYSKIQMEIRNNESCRKYYESRGAELESELAALGESIRNLT